MKNDNLRTMNGPDNFHMQMYTTHPYTYRIVEIITQIQIGADLKMNTLTIN